VKYILTTNYLKGLLYIIEQANMTVVPNISNGKNKDSNILSLAAMLSMN